MTNQMPDIKAKNPFETFLDSQLSLNERREFIQNIRSGLDISKSTFYRKAADTAQFSTSDKMFIAQLADKPLLELFPTDI